MLQALKDAFRKSVPSRDELAASPVLRPIANHLFHPKLWHMQHESVARGVAIGMFWAFVIPVGQIVAAAAHCVWWRANIPIAAGITFITNPFTIGFWLYLAYHVGRVFIDAAPPRMPGGEVGVWQALTSIGWPAIVGMGIFATVGSVGGYFISKYVWRYRVLLKLAERRKARLARRSR